jgi:hypothetical protein
MRQRRGLEIRMDRASAGEGERQGMAQEEEISLFI